MADPKLPKVTFNLEDGRFTVSEWEEVCGYLMIEYKEEDCTSVELPVLSKAQWETLKRVGDFVFSEMGAV